jgi:asparaginyl-tRNA synthetase
MPSPVKFPSRFESFWNQGLLKLKTTYSLVKKECEDEDWEGWRRLNKNMLNLKKIIAQAENISQQKSLKVSGWVQSIRQNKFIEIRDGSSLKTLQLLVPPTLLSQLKTVKFGSYLQAEGQLTLTPHRTQNCELRIEKITSVSSPDEDYPFQKHKMPLTVVRTYPHLRSKTNYFLALFRLRHSISKVIHDFFDQEGFYYVPTPIITSNDAEGAGESFSVTTHQKAAFFAKPAQLTVSGQLHAEALAQGLGKVYTFGPCFRAEKSHTTRHLAEFWMVEAELVPTDLTALLKLVQNLVKFVLRAVLAKHREELEYLEKYSQKEIISKLVAGSEKDFISLDYTQALQILSVMSCKNFVFSPLEWGKDLKAEHEKYLSHYFGNQPIFITNYPRDLKAFYMKNNADGKTVAGFDLIFPEIGELIGGSMREDNHQILLKKAQKVGLDINNLSWYFDLRKSGYAPSGGFGLGLERLIMFISGSENIQDTLAFPCFHRHLDY